MRTHQFSTSPGRCVGKGGRQGWLGRGEPSPARAPGPGPLSTGLAARAWLPGSRSGETGPWPGAQQPPPRAGQPAERARGNEIEDRWPARGQMGARHLEGVCQLQSPPRTPGLKGRKGPAPFQDACYRVGRLRSAQGADKVCLQQDVETPHLSIQLEPGSWKTCQVTAPHISDSLQVSSFVDSN